MFWTNAKSERGARLPRQSFGGHVTWETAFGTMVLRFRKTPFLCPGFHPLHTLYTYSTHNRKPVPSHRRWLLPKQPPRPPTATRNATPYTRRLYANARWPLGQEAPATLARSSTSNILRPPSRPGQLGLETLRCGEARGIQGYASGPLSHLIHAPRMRLSPSSRLQPLHSPLFSPMSKLMNTAPEQEGPKTDVAARGRERGLRAFFFHSKRSSCIFENLAAIQTIHARPEPPKRKILHFLPLLHVRLSSLTLCISGRPRHGTEGWAGIVRRGCGP